MPGKGKDQGKGMLGYGVLAVRGDVGYLDASPPAGFQVNVIVPGGASGYQAQARQALQQAAIHSRVNENRKDFHVLQRSPIGLLRFTGMEADLMVCQPLAQMRCFPIVNLKKSNAHGTSPGESTHTIVGICDDKRKAREGCPVGGGI